MIQIYQNNERKMAQNNLLTLLDRKRGYKKWLFSFKLQDEKKLNKKEILIDLEADILIR
jgi:hypothetical protein